MSALTASLRHYWKTSLAVVAPPAATTAVLTGALVVGDSMRGSLRDLALERLGAIDEALLSEPFFRAELATEVAGRVGSDRLVAAVPAILLRGSASVPGSGRRAAGVQIQGVDEGFASLFGAELGLEAEAGQRSTSVVLNERLATELAVSPGDAVLLALARPSDIPRESLMGSTDVSDVVQSLRTTVRAVIPDRDLGRFSLEPIQSVAFNAFVPLDELQEALDQEGRVNALFFDLATDATGSDGESPIEAAVARSLQIGDLGLRLGVGPGEGASTPADVVSLESREIVMRPVTEEAVRRWAEGAGLEVLEISSYLANRTTVEGRADGALLPYSTITGLDLGSRGFGDLRWVAGEPGSLQPDEVAINEWAAEDLGAEPGDSLRIQYWEVGDKEELIPREVVLRLRGVLALEGLAADATLTPPYPGVHDADDMADWEPTFPVDLGLIDDRDEEYWDRYRATPKLFVAPQRARELWASRFGVVSSLRLRAAEGTGGDGGGDRTDLQEDGAEQREAAGVALAERVRAELPDRIDPAAAGLAVLPIRESALRGSGGATDFGGLFLGFSMFLIAAAALLAALFFRLGVERRAAEIGLRLGVGFPPRQVRRLFLQEGLLLAGVGVALGLVLAVVYAMLMIAALGSRWAAALGLDAGEVQFLRLHVEPVTLAIGGVASFVVIVIAIWRSVRRLEKLPAVQLLRGEIRTEGPAGTRPGRLSTWVLRIAGPLTVLAVGSSFLVDEGQAAPVFFAAGALLLICGLALFAVLLRRRAGLIERSGARGQLAMARSNVSLAPGRSLLAVALVAAASFVIVAVGAYGRQFGREEVSDPGSGAGGFVLSARSDVPLYHDLGTPDGRFELGFSGGADEAFGEREVFSLRVVPGDDVSCLNLYQPESPRLLGVPPDFVDRGGFHFQQVLDSGEPVDNPWRLLEEDLGEGVVPAIGDLNSVMWILKSGLGQDVEVENERGEPIRLRLVGLLHKSIFQSELLIAEDALLEHFPSRTGYRAFLLAAGGEGEAADDDAFAELLEQRLSRFGFDVTGTAAQLEAFQAVENTYLGTFQTLGGLGLLLGTLGLAVVLLRNVLERTSELALLRAVGFRRRFLGGLVVAENALLLFAGLALGTLAALLAVAPHLAGGGASVPVLSLAATLALVFLVGLAASSIAAREAMNVQVLRGLRTE